jgi:excisionase family DNA binding protein
MSATNHRRPPQIPFDEESAQAREAARQLARLLPENERPLRLITEGDGRESMSIPPGVARLFLDALTQLGQGRAVTIAPEKAELTTQEVADYLNVSCPFVVKLIESGKLPARMVGQHRHASFADLIKFDEQDNQARRAALDELARIDQELKL